MMLKRQAAAALAEVMFTTVVQMRRFWHGKAVFSCFAVTAGSVFLLRATTSAGGARAVFYAGRDRDGLLSRCCCSSHYTKLRYAILLYTTLHDAAIHHTTLPCCTNSTSLPLLRFTERLLTAKEVVEVCGGLSSLVSSWSRFCSSRLVLSQRIVSILLASSCIVSSRIRSPCLVWSRLDLSMVLSPRHFLSRRVVSCLIFLFLFQFFYKYCLTFLFRAVSCAGVGDMGLYRGRLPRQGRVARPGLQDLPRLGQPRLAGLHVGRQHLGGFCCTYLVYTSPSPSVMVDTVSKVSTYRIYIPTWYILWRGFCAPSAFTPPPALLLLPMA